MSKIRHKIPFPPPPEAAAGKGWDVGRSHFQAEGDTPPEVNSVASG